MKLPYGLSLILLLGLLFISSVFSQSEGLVHDRGMLHQTVYNSGAIGYPALQSAGHSIEQPRLEPAGEWPPYSSFLEADRVYSGSHNMMGGGIQLVAIPAESSLVVKNEIYSLCSGYFDPQSGQNYLPTAIGHSFPISFTKIENYPVLQDGSINLAYNPNEAEQIIEAVFATRTGIEVKRTSRVWSYPDYDDFIIYEYELVYNGNTDNDPTTIEMNSPYLKDCIVAFNMIMVPSRLGFDRNYGNWDPYLFNQSPIHGSYQDHDYWITYSQNVKTGENYNAAGMPEPDPQLFYEWASTGEHGGGLLSPQAYGIAVLYYENDHRAIVSPDQSINESQLWHWFLVNLSGAFDSLGNDIYLKRQPFQLHASGGYETPTDMWIIDPRQGRGGPFFGTMNEWWNPNGGYPPIDTLWSEEQKERWKGRNFIIQRAWAAGYPQHHLQFGPYKLYKDVDKLQFTIAEVVGYGTEHNKYLLGGERNRTTDVYWDYVPGWNRRIETADGILLTENYLEEFGYPDYINSSVATIQDVTHKAFEAYLGVDSASLEVPVWPENNPADGLYNSMKIPFPAPSIRTRNTDLAQVEIIWTTQAEDVTQIIPESRLAGDLASYNVYKSDDRVNWDLLASVARGDVNAEGFYVVLDANVVVGDLFYYAVTSVDEQGGESGKTNITKNEVQLGSTKTLGNVYVVPNPFNISSKFAGKQPTKIGFYNLPTPCTIRIFSLAGQQVATLEHTAPNYSHEFFQITRSDQSMASGVYFYAVETPDGSKTSGKFIIIR